MKSRLIDEPVPFRLLAIALLIAAYFWIYRPSEASRELLINSARLSSAQAEVGEDTLRRRRFYEAQAEQIRSELGSLSLDADQASMISNLLEDLDAKARDHQIQVRGIEPRHDLVVHAGAPFNLHLAGKYLALTAYLDELSRLRTLVQLDAIRVSRTQQAIHAGETPDLEADVAVTILPVHAHSSGDLQ